MAGRRELGFPKTTSCSLKEQLARTTLRHVRSQGHTYVELREDGKKFIFFCTLCLAPCYSDSVLFDHLRGSLHSERYEAAKVTLIRSNPWPFNDGVLFFNNLSEPDKLLATQNVNKGRLLEAFLDDGNTLAIVSYDENLRPAINGHISEDGVGGKNNSEYQVVHMGSVDNSLNRDFNGDCGNSDLVIPGVLCKGEISDLPVTSMGVGQIGARFYEKDGVALGISKIWCEWLGNTDYGDKDSPVVPILKFSVVTFPYDYDLGRKGLLDDLRSLLSSSPHSELEEADGSRKKKRKSFSDPEDISESLSNQYDSSGEESLTSNASDLRLVLNRYDEQLMYSRVLSSKTMRRELRRQQQVAAERMCDICQHKMLPGKDVAALLNRETGRLVCSSRNVNGAFHVFHISCLIHWILLCELEIYTNQLGGPKVKRRSRKKSGVKCNGNDKNVEQNVTKRQIYSEFCPECQGTGVYVDGDELERPTVPLSEMFRYKIKVNDARRAWMKNPEMLQNCSTGFHFPSQSEEMHQGEVSLLKLLHFYRAAA